MRWLRFVAVWLVAVALVGCDQSVAPSLVAPASGACAGIPLIDRNNPPDTLPLTRDPILEAKLPEQIDGQLVTGVSSGRYVETLCMLGGDASVTAAEKRLSSGVSLADINVASGQARVDDAQATISAFRLPGGSGTAVISLLGMDESQPNPMTVGGKQVLVWHNSAVSSSVYAYATGDTVFDVEDVTESQAGKILAALP
jgi:hypothetical protein